MYIRAHVTPNARKESVVKNVADSFLISVKEPASYNAANKRVRALIAHHYGVPLGKVRLVSGHTSPRKIYTLDADAV